MYLLVSVPNEEFHRVMCLRALQRQLGIDASMNRDASELFRAIAESFGGRIVLLDWSNGAVMADFPLAGASGLAIHNGMIFASSWTAHCIHVINGHELISTISHRWFNHLHSVEITSRDTLLIASAGNDLLLEVSLDGSVLWNWFSPDHGYSAPPQGQPFSFNPSADYRQMRRATSERAVHFTCALPLVDESVLATLFHQGELILIDRLKGKATVMLRGLSRPHGIHRRPGGFLLSDTLGHRVLLLDEAVRACSEIPFGCEWLQDTIATSSGTYLTMENVHIDQLPQPGLSNRIAEIDSGGRPLRQLNVGPNCRLFTVREIDAEFARWIAREWGRNGDLNGWVWN
jgi:hypothetical protein